MSQEDIDNHNNSVPSESPQGNEEINPNQEQEEKKRKWTKRRKQRKWGK